MTAPRRKARGLAASPFIPDTHAAAETAEPVQPARAPDAPSTVVAPSAQRNAASAAPGSKVRLSVYVTPALADAVRDTFTAIGDHDDDPESLSDFASNALLTEIRRLENERNGGQPFPPRRQRKLRPGQR